LEVSKIESLIIPKNSFIKDWRLKDYLSRSIYSGGLVRKIIEFCFMKRGKKYQAQFPVQISNAWVIYIKL
jgi:hypothetical protein